MLILLSPAKTLDFISPIKSRKHTQPRLLAQSQSLVAAMREYSPPQLADLMGISDNLAAVNVKRFREWQTPFTLKNARAAIFAFKGDVYGGLDAETLTAAELDFAQQQVRILSGLYGLLRPFDLMQPYRLEMGKNIRIAQNPTTLYQFWDTRITDLIQADGNKMGSETVINLASNEYFKAVKRKHLTAEIITPAFKDWKNGTYKVVSFWAKKARGEMTRYIIQHRITDAQQLKTYTGGGYAYNSDLSNAEKNAWVFTREA